MKSLHCRQSLVDCTHYSQCRLWLEWGSSSTAEVVIGSGDYADAYEIVAALDTEMAAAIDGGAAAIGGDGMVTLSANVSFGMDLGDTTVEQARYTTLLTLLGFDTGQAFTPAVSHTAPRCPFGTFWTDFVNEVSPDSGRILIHRARGSLGRRASVGLGSELRFEIRLDYLDPEKRDSLLEWYEMAADGRKVRYCNSASDYIEATLAPPSLTGIDGFLRRMFQKAHYWAARFELRKEEA